MKIYLSGPMRGSPHFNVEAFDYAAAKLRAEGHEVYSPADRDREILGDEIYSMAVNADHIGAPVIGKLDIRKALAEDLAYICLEADAIALLPGWQQSLGARAEAHVAAAVGKTLMELGRDYIKSRQPDYEKPQAYPERDNNA